MTLPSFSRRPRPSREEVDREFKRLAKNAREGAENEARFEYVEIEKRAQRIKSVEKRVQFIHNSIEEIGIKVAEEQRFVEESETVNDLEAAHRYLELLALTARKLRVLLAREESEIPSLTGSSPNYLKPSSGDELKSVESADTAAQGQEKDFLNIKEVAALTGIPTNTIYKLTANGKIPHSKIGQRLYFKRSRIVDWLRKHERGSP